MAVFTVDGRTVFKSRIKELTSFVGDRGSVEMKEGKFVGMNVFTGNGTVLAEIGDSIVWDGRKFKVRPKSWLGAQVLAEVQAKIDEEELLDI